MSDGFAPLCVAPWENIIVAENRYRPCCRIMAGVYRQPPSNEAELLEVFNSPFMRDLRRRLATGDVKGTACQSCIRAELHYPELADYSRLTAPLLRERVEAVREAIAQGREEMEQPPLNLALSLPGVCNIRCKMCTVHSDARRGKPRKGNVFVPHAKSLIASLQKRGIPMLTVAGGEPLFTPATLEIMDFAARELHPQTILSTTTNGKLLDKHMDLLRRFDHLDVNVSVDGHGQAYEEVRVGETWEHILANLRLLSQEAAERPGWRIATRTVLMRTTIPSLPEMVPLFLELGFEPEFSPIFGDFLDENVYMFSGLLKGMDWKADFDRGIEAAREAGHERLRRHLAKRRDELELQAEKGINTYYRAYPDRLEHLTAHLESRFRGQRVILLGLTEETGYFLFHYQATEPDFTIAGVCLLEDLPEEVTEVLGLPIIPPEEAPRLDTPFLLACYSRDFDRYKEFAETCLGKERVHVLSPDVVEARTDEALAQTAGGPVVLFGAGGCADLLLDSTELARANVVAFSDNDKRKWGSTFRDLPVVPPSEIPEWASEVVICSRAFEYDIERSLVDAHGEALRVHRLYS
ncbi:radical SAM protein [Desulfohalovibrio reitneri]|uniref:radical SAM protein n=1 Tax=Desulfohalovibrio reitneri TaxID=1307759 RepID=UPI0004A6B7DA|nr:radical SAM protein [Desulfohalovibrio reitneri]